MAEEYNGWANWETWNANLWLTNDEGVYDMVLDAVEGAADEYEAGDAIRGMVEVAADEGIRLIGDEMSIWRIEWSEIGKSFLDLVRELEDKNVR